MQETLTARPPAPDVSSYLGRSLALAFGAFILIGANDGGAGVLLPSFQAQYHIDKATVSLMFLAGTTGYLGAALSSGLLVERLGQRRFLLVGAGAMLLGLTLLVLKPPFAAVLCALLLNGFGSGIIDAGLNAYVAGLPRNSSLLNYLHAFYGVGALIGPLVASGILALGWGWNNVYLVWAGLCLLVLVGAGLIFPRAPAPSAAQAAGSPNVLVAALRLRAVMLAAVFLFIYVGMEVSLGSWSYSFLTEERHQPELLAGWAVSGYWLGLTLGRLVLGRVAERLGPRRLVDVCLVGVGLGVVLVWFAPIGLVAALGLGLAGFSLGPIFPTTIALLSNLVPERLLASAIGFAVSVGSVGAACFPWLAGNLIERLGLPVLLPYALALTLGSALIWWVLPNRRPQADMV